MDSKITMCNTHAHHANICTFWDSNPRMLAFVVRSANRFAKSVNHRLVLLVKQTKNQFCVSPETLNFLHKNTQFDATFLHIPSEITPATMKEKHEILNVN